MRTSGSPPSAAHYKVVAHNYAHDSENKIHSDDVAAQYGFKGGLVPGVADYAYLARAVLEVWGSAWLSRGAMEAKFIKPVYHGETAHAVAHWTEGADGTGDDARLELSLLNPSGEICASGRAEHSHRGTPPRLEDFPRLAAAARREPEIATFPPGLQLGAYEYAYDARAARRDAESMFADAVPATEDGTPLWHPAACLHDANRILRANVNLGPWIHTASRVEYYDQPRDGETLSLRGRVLDTYEKRGHVMTDADLAVFALPAGSGEGRALTRIRHSAIIRLRASDAA